MAILNREFSTTLASAPQNSFPAPFGAFAHQKTVGSFSFSLFGLIGNGHDDILVYKDYKVYKVCKVRKVFYPPVVHHL